ncbi:MAG TPA: ribosome small subunit-dependent GTPase A [Clostridiales bacterium]|nr:ribosome small subunit-dependent GTPase A [Clostridiales bacterium]
MKGKIIKGIAGFYYVHSPENNFIYECKPKGIFRKQKIKPLVGDDVEISTDDVPEGSGVITDVLPRNNELIRPAVANVDQALVLFAAAEPDPNLNLLDRFLVMMEKQNVRTSICFNKMDIVSNKKMSTLKDTYTNCGYDVFAASIIKEEGIHDIYEYIKGKTTVLAGPSGVGKSSLINRLAPEANMETGDVSEKIKRGRHTTRHSELKYVEEDTYIMDTPGFSSLYINEMETDELKEYYIEFKKFDNYCRFIGCNHINEPDCAIKDGLNDKKISDIRYKNYILLYEELKAQKRY